MIMIMVVRYSLSPIPINRSGFYDGLVYASSNDDADNVGEDDSDDGGGNVI